jgi:sugar O-acyltransferase (sialic acid O-acetyltransferase NeuD family)
VSEAHEVVIIGAGGHARVLLDMLSLLKIPVAGMTDVAASLAGREIFGVRVLGDDEALQRFPCGTTRLVNGLGSVKTMDARRAAFARLRARGYGFLTLAHPSAVVSARAVLGEGVQALARSVVQCGARIGANSILNTGAQVDHDCVVGDHVHLAPGVTLSGDVHIGDGSHVGTGAVVVQGVRIGAGCLVAAGAVVISDVPDGARVGGVPAKALRG